MGVWIVVGIAARMTGETDIDPYEQFGIIVVVCVGLVWALMGLDLDYTSSLIIVVFVTVAAAVVGDIGFDYKSAKIIGTRASDMVKADIAAVVCAGIATPFVLEIIRTSYADKLFTEVMPATQAVLVAGSINGFTYPEFFAIGFAVAFLWEVAHSALKMKPKVTAMAFGIGMFIGFALSIPFAIGGIIRYVIERKRPGLRETGLIASAGVMGGIGIGGFLQGTMIVAGISSGDSLTVLGVLFALLFFVGFYYWRRR